MKIHEKWVDYTDGRSTRPMTPQEIRRLSSDALVQLFADQQADALPVGKFHGDAWSDDSPFIAVFGNIWQGKVFSRKWRYAVLDSVWRKKVTDGVTVRNTIRHEWLNLLPGDVTLHDGSVWIDYQQLGLRDELKPIKAGLWLGRMQLGPSVIWFTLEQET